MKKPTKNEFIVVMIISVLAIFAILYTIKQASQFLILGLITIPIIIWINYKLFMGLR